MPARIHDIMTPIFVFLSGNPFNAVLIKNDGYQSPLFDTCYLLLTIRSTELKFTVPSGSSCFFSCVHISFPLFLCSGLFLINLIYKGNIHAIQNSPNGSRGKYRSLTIRVLQYWSERNYDR